MKDDSQHLDAIVETFAALLSEEHSREHYLLLHKLRDSISVWRADASAYNDTMFGICEDILTRSIGNLNALRRSK